MEKFTIEGLDKIDEQILSELQHNSRITTKELCSILNLSQTPIYERIKRLEREGYIKNYVALLDKDKLGKQMVVFCNVQLKEHAKPYLMEFEEEIKKLKEVVECYYIAGNFDYTLKVMVKDMKAYQNFLVNKLASLENIGNAQSLFVMTEVKWSTEVPIDK